MSDLNDLSAMGKVLDEATELLRRQRVAAYVDRCRRDEETILDLIDQYGLRELKQMIDCVYDASREPDDRYLDDPRRGQAAAINKGEF
jgi:hypothetical protein